MEALRIIADEHQALAGVLHAVRFMVGEIRAGQLEPDMALFEAMIHYLDAYAEARHHPKEDLLFERLSQRSDQARDALATLAREHQAAPERIAALQQAFQTWKADPKQFPLFAQAFEQYADFYRGHMVLEEEAVLPLLPKHLTPEDQQELDAAFKAFYSRLGQDPKAEDFSAMFSKFVECAPAPIGFGPRRYQP